jgi:hypothetical protein
MPSNKLAFIVLHFIDHILCLWQNLKQETYETTKRSRCIILIDNYIRHLHNCKVSGGKMSTVMSFVLLFLLSIVGMMILQYEFNKAGTTPEVAAAGPAPNPEGAAPAMPAPVSSDNFCNIVGILFNLHGCFRNLPLKRTVKNK